MTETSKNSFDDFIFSYPKQQQDNLLIFTIY